MAEFSLALTETLSHEAGYVYHPSDRGGETYKGIARNFHGSWIGWKRIDQYKVSATFPDILEEDAAIGGWVRDFYRNKFWNPVAGDVIKDQGLAVFMFDMAVHIGTGKAVEFLQRALNLFNREGKLYADLVVDGDIGPATLKAITKYYMREGPGSLFKALIVLRGNYYVEVTERREKNEAFIRGWLNRLRLR